MRRLKVLSELSAVSVPRNLASLTFSIPGIEECLSDRIDEGVLSAPPQARDLIVKTTRHFLADGRSTSSADIQTYQALPHAGILLLDPTNLLGSRHKYCQLPAHTDTGEDTNAAVSRECANELELRSDGALLDLNSGLSTR